MSDKPGAKADQPESLESLFKAYEAPLLRYAYKLVKDNHVSQEIVQETFMRLHTQMDRVEKQRPWLYRTAHNLALNHLRSKKKIVPLEIDGEDDDGPRRDGPADDAPLPSERIERREAIQQTRVCLEMLDQRERELVRLKFEEGCSYAQISEATGLSVSNVGYILHHALKRLGSKLKQEGVQL